MRAQIYRFFACWKFRCVLISQSTGSLEAHSHYCLSATPHKYRSSGSTLGVCLGTSVFYEQRITSVNIAVCMQKSQGCYFFGAPGHCGELTGLQAAIGCFAVLDILTTFIFMLAVDSVHGGRGKRSVSPNQQSTACAVFSCVKGDVIRLSIQDATLSTCGKHGQ